MRNGPRLRFMVDFEVYTTLSIDPLPTVRLITDFGIPFGFVIGLQLSDGPHLPAKNPRCPRSLRIITNPRGVSGDSCSPVCPSSPSSAVHLVTKIGEDLAAYRSAALLKRSSMTLESTSPDWL